MKKLILSLAAAVLVCASGISYAQEQEEITLTTYYPAPYGDYDALTVNTLYFDTSESRDGLIGFFDTNSIYSQRLRITAGSSDTVGNSQGASIDLHGNDYTAGGKSGDLDLVAGMGSGTNAGDITFWTGAAAAEQRMIINSNGNVGIGTNQPQGILDLDVSSQISSGTHSGFIPPRMTTAQRNTIANPVNGMMIFNTDTNQLEVCTGGAWGAVGGGGPKVYSAAGVSDVETSSTSYVQMPDMNIILPADFPGGKVFIVFNAMISSVSPSEFNCGTVRVVIDGDQKTFAIIGSTNLMSTLTWSGFVGSGSHAIEVEWQREWSVSLRQFAPVWGERTLTVLTGLL